MVQLLLVVTLCVTIMLDGDTLEIEKLVWDPSTQKKVADKHGLGRWEVEEIFLGNCHIRRSGNLYYAYGQSAAGRYIFVVFIYLGRGRAHVVTARDMTPKERRFYQKEKGG